MNYFEKQLEKLVKVLIRGLRANGHKDVGYGDDGALMFNLIRYYLAPKPCDHHNMKVMEPAHGLRQTDGFKWCDDCGAFQRIALFPELAERHPKLYALRLPKAHKGKS